MSASEIKITAYILAVIYGLCIGSFLNSVIYRLPRGISLVKPPSHCPKCKARIRWYDNIPVISYIILKGRCRSCKERIPFRYTAVELLNSALWFLCVFVLWDKSPLYSAAAAIACSLLIAIAAIDFENMYMFDALTFLLCIPAAMMAASAYIWNYGATLIERLIGAAALGGFFLLVYAIAKLFFKREALGTGDIIFEAFQGALLGWKAGLIALIIGAVSAAAVTLPASVILKKKEFPFGPFLAAGTIFSLFFAEPIINFYSALLGG